MSYKLYTDKQEVFECKIHLEGASLTKANSRIIVETQYLNLMFEGTIDKDGNCKVPIKKLRGLLGEDDKGTMKLEVIAEDTYFQPWESKFTVDTKQKLTVEVKEQAIIKKPKIVVTEIKQDPVGNLVKLLKQKNITVKEIIKRKEKLIPMIKEYHSQVNYKKNSKHFIREVISKLTKH